MPTANMATMRTTPAANCLAPVRLNLRQAQPKTMATKVNKIEIVPAQPAA